MNRQEKEALEAHINRFGLNHGEVIRISGQWYVEGDDGIIRELMGVNPPQVNMSWWGSGDAVIDGDYIVKQDAPQPTRQTPAPQREKASQRVYVGRQRQPSNPPTRQNNYEEYHDIKANGRNHSSYDDDYRQPPSVSNGAKFWLFVLLAMMAAATISYL